MKLEGQLLAAASLVGAAVFYWILQVFSSRSRRYSSQGFDIFYSFQNRGGQYKGLVTPWSQVQHADSGCPQGEKDSPMIRKNLIFPLNLREQRTANTAKKLLKD